ncbi:Crp/Fnr family transcriptional regulator [Ignavigranum ruoffiae]|uniref:Crp/Fnr family transcriptional regulator n=1 Tax=Ignavigranum ruoffiae TaxID=89093 RepID=UPI00204D2C08|nr:Crp/Fnr family transcriptional regulator [Ignavigranum ruoffiae]UPQ85019.1 Crp/Fnr family transcriptional regulator [Ignavigranum ruoffiae]
MVNRDFEAYFEYLESEEFFLGFTPEELLKVKQLSVIHQYRKGQIIYFQDDPKRYCYFLLKGFIRLERTDTEDTYIYIDYIKEKNFFSYSSVLNFERYTHSAYSVTDVDLLLIPMDLIIEIIRQNHNQLLYMYCKLSEIQVFQEARIQQTAISSAVDRVIQSLSLWMFDMGRMIRGHMTIPYPLTIYELGLVAGTTRETAGRVVRKLTKEGKVKFTRKQVIFYDEDYFKENAKFLQDLGTDYAGQLIEILNLA